jgi:hypothetical protein
MRNSLNILGKGDYIMRRDGSYRAHNDTYDSTRYIGSDGSARSGHRDRRSRNPDHYERRARERDRIRGEERLTRIHDIIPSISNGLRDFETWLIDFQAFGNELNARKQDYLKSNLIMSEVAKSLERHERVEYTFEKVNNADETGKEIYTMLKKHQTFKEFFYEKYRIIWNDIFRVKDSIQTIENIAFYQADGVAMQAIRAFRDGFETSLRGKAQEFQTHSASSRSSRMELDKSFISEEQLHAVRVWLSEMEDFTSERRDRVIAWQEELDNGDKV